MKNYYIDIAPDYASNLTASLTDGKHGCNIEAEGMEEAIEKVKAKAEAEKWPTGHALITELNALGQKVEGFMCTGPKVIEI